LLFWIVALSLFRWPSAGPCFNCPSSDSGFRVICCHVLALPVSPAPESPSSCGSSQGPRNCRAEPGRARWTDRGNMDGSERSSDTADESEAEQNNRNLNDLLQELRVADLGVQLLFGLLLGLPFTVRFSRLDGSGQNPLSSQPDLRCIGHGAVGEPCRLQLLGVPSTRKGAVTRFRQRAGHSRAGDGGRGSVCGHLDGHALRRPELARRILRRHRNRQLAGIVVRVPDRRPARRDHWPRGALSPALAHTVVSAKPLRVSATMPPSAADCRS